MRVTRRTLVGALLAAPLLPLRKLHAEESALDFFDGKTIAYVIASSPGGGYDTYGRLIARYLEKHIPGVSIAVINAPGAGGIIGLNKIYHAPADGLSIGTFNTGLIYSQLLDMPGVQFDLSKMSWIGKAAGEPRILIVSAKSPYHSIEDVRESTEPVTFATTGPGSQNYIMSSLIAESLGVLYKVVPGYSSSERSLAVIQGQVTGITGSYSSADRLVRDRHARIVLQIGASPGHPAAAYPSAIPMISATFGKSVGDLLLSSTQMLRLTAGPPGIDPARLEVLRGAFRSALRDPGLLAEAERMGRPIDPAFGSDVAKGIDEALDLPPDVRKAFKDRFAPQSD